MNGLADLALLAVKPLFAGNLAKLSSSEKNSGLSALFPLVDLLILVELVALAGELLFVDGSAKLTLALLTLEVGIIPAEGLAELVALIAAVDSPALLVLFDYLAESPFVEFNSFKFFQAVAPGESTGFFPEIQVFAPLMPLSNSTALTLSVSVFFFCFQTSSLGISKILRISFID